MASNNTNPLDKAINLRQLQMAHADIRADMVQYEETTSPASADVIDEYQRITAALYQALEDAQQVVVPARQAAALVDAAKGNYETLEERIRAAEIKAANIGFVADTDPMSLI